MKFKFEKMNDKTHGVFLADFLRAIPDGEENAVTTRELARLFDVHPRIITATVAHLRKMGVVLCSSGAGYFVPGDDEELRHFVRCMRSRVREIELATVSAEKALARREAANHDAG